MANAFSGGEFQEFPVTGWQENTQNIHVPPGPFELQVTVESAPAFVDLTEACGSWDPLVLRLESSSTLRFRKETIEIEGQEVQDPMILGATVRPGADIHVGPEPLAPAPPRKRTCRHGFSPPSRCPQWPHE